MPLLPPAHDRGDVRVLVVGEEAGVRDLSRVLPPGDAGDNDVAPLARRRLAQTSAT